MTPQQQKTAGTELHSAVLSISHLAGLSVAMPWLPCGMSRQGSQAFPDGELRQDGEACFSSMAGLDERPLMLNGSFFAAVCSERSLPSCWALLPWIDTVVQSRECLQKYFTTPTVFNSVSSAMMSASRVTGRGAAGGEATTTANRLTINRTENLRVSLARRKFCQVCLECPTADARRERAEAPRSAHPQRIPRRFSRQKPFVIAMAPTSGSCRVGDRRT